MRKFTKISKKEWDSLPKMKFQNVCLDFSVEAGVLKKLPNGNVKVAWESGSGPAGVTYQVKIAKKQGDHLKVFEGGSPCNSYVKRL